MPAPARPTSTRWRRSGDVRAVSTPSVIEKLPLPLQTLTPSAASTRSPGDRSWSAAPAAPNALTVEKRQRNKATLTWSDAASDESGFYVYTSTDGVNWTKYATVNPQAGTGTVTFNTGGFARGPRYFQVTAFNSAGESTTSNVGQFTV